MPSGCWLEFFGRPACLLLRRWSEILLADEKLDNALVVESLFSLGVGQEEIGELEGRSPSLPRKEVRDVGAFFGVIPGLVDLIGMGKASFGDGVLAGGILFIADISRDDFVSGALYVKLYLMEAFLSGMVSKAWSSIWNGLGLCLLSSSEFGMLCSFFLVEASLEG